MWSWGAAGLTSGKQGFEESLRVEGWESVGNGRWHRQVQQAKEIPTHVEDRWWEEWRVGSMMGVRLKTYGYNLARRDDRRTTR